MPYRVDTGRRAPIPDECDVINTIAKRRGLSPTVVAGSMVTVSYRHRGRFTLCSITGVGTDSAVGMAVHLPDDPAKRNDQVGRINALVKAGREYCDRFMVAREVTQIIHSS